MKANKSLRHLFLYGALSVFFRFAHRWSLLMPTRAKAIRRFPMGEIRRSLQPMILGSMIRVRNMTIGAIGRNLVHVSGA